MGLHLSAYASEAAASEHQSEFSGKLLEWKQVVELTHKHWFE